MKRYPVKELGPKISVVTVVFNGASTIESSILSVKAQTYGNIEYIVVDGGSVDGTVEILERYNEEITYWNSERDTGIYNAMNKSLGIATGDWLLFLGCDDVLASADAIEATVRLMEDEKTVYYGNILFRNTRELYPGRHMSKFRFSARNFPHQALFYPRVIYKEHTYDERYKLYADYVYNLKLFHMNKDLFHYIPVLVCDYNDRGRSHFTLDREFVGDRLALIRNCLGWQYYIYIFIRQPIGFLKRYLSGFKG